MKTPSIDSSYSHFLADTLAVIWELDSCRYYATVTASVDTGQLKNEIQVGEKVVLGVRLYPLRELMGWFLGSTRFFPGDFSSLVKRLKKDGFTVSEIAAVYPGLDQPRFIFPAVDSSSHMFLFQSIFLPRRYSLPLAKRMLLKASIYTIRLFGSTPYLFTCMCLLVERSEKFDT
jgi:hypothetical protein